MTTESIPAESASTNVTAAPAPLTPPAETAITAAPLPDAGAPAPAAQAPTWPFRVDWLLLGLLLVLSFFLASFAASNSDLWLHLAIGKGLSEGTVKPDGVDPYS